MSINDSSIFKPRKTRKHALLTENENDLLNQKKTESNEDICISTFNKKNRTGRELTKNERYCLSKLPASLPLENTQNQFLSGFSDHKTNYSILITEKNVYVWYYQSTDTVPLYINFSSKEIFKTSVKLLAILVSSSNGSIYDPGILIIDSYLGHLKYYESIQHAPALGLINNELKMIIPLNTKKNEYITTSKNVEPAGVIIVTSLKRFFLVILKDNIGKPKLSYIELLTLSNIGIFSNLFFTNKDDYLSDNEYVTIESVRISNNGSRQEIFILDFFGNFEFITFNLLNVIGPPSVDKKLSYKHSLASILIKTLGKVFQLVLSKIRFFDMIVLPKSNELYLSLIYVEDSKKNKMIFLIVLKIDQTGILLCDIFKTLNCDLDFHFVHANKPKLFLPSPYKFLFVVFKNFIKMIDIDLQKFTSGNLTSENKLCWDDSIKLNSMVELLGYGYENQSSTTNPAIILITKDHGVLRLERFLDVTINRENGSLKVLKSHIEQAIFYYNTKEVDFDFMTKTSSENVVDAIQKINSELIKSTSPYLSNINPSLIDFLELKSKTFKNLIDFSKKNFEQHLFKIIPITIYYLEKVDMALNLWIDVNNGEHHLQKKKKLFQIIKNLLPFQSEKDYDVIINFFKYENKSINKVFSDYIDFLCFNSEIDFSPVNLIIKTFYDGIYLTKKKYNQKFSFLSEFKFWNFDFNLIKKIDEIFTNESRIIGPQDSVDSKDNLIKICEILYYLTNHAINYMKKHDLNNNELKKYIEFYASRKYIWFKTLSKLNLMNKAISIAENHNDFFSICEILEIKKSKVIGRYGVDSFEYDELKKKYQYYFDNFKDEFSTCLYNYYIKTEKIYSLIFNYQEYKNNLETFFRKNKQETCHVSWIYYAYRNDFFTAFNTIISHIHQDSNEKIEVNELKHSFAKLFYIENNNVEKNVQKHLSENHLHEIEFNLENLRIQMKVYQSLKNDNNDIRKIEDIHNPLVAFADFKKIILPFYSTFLDKKTLNYCDLVNFITLINPKLNSSLFYDALQIASKVKNEVENIRLTKIILLRLLTLGDDWSFLNKSNLYSTKDYIIENIITKTNLYDFFLRSDNVIVLKNHLNDLLTLQEIDSHSKKDSTYSDLDKKLLLILRDYKVNYNLNGWLDHITKKTSATKDSILINVP